MTARRVTSKEEIAALVTELFDPDRSDPVVVVTTRNGEIDPIIDADRLASDIAPVPVRLIATGELTWELTSLLPDELGVFGGAARIWWPGLTAESRPHEHPLVFAYQQAEGERAVRRIRDELTREARTRESDWRAWQRRTPAAPVPNRRITPKIPVGALVTGTVLHATPGGAEVQTEPGVHGWLVRRRRDAELGVGDHVQVKIVSYDGGDAVLERAPRPKAPTPSAVPRPGPRPRPGPPGSRRPAAVGLDEAAALAEARTLIAALQQAVADADEDRAAAEARAKAAATELTQAVKSGRRAVQELKREIRSLKDRAAFLEAQLRGTGRYEDAEQQFRHEVDVAWASANLGADRERFPLPPYLIGPFFLSSLAALEGVSRAKIVEVSTEVLTGRAATSAGRELHPLRTDEGGDAEQRIRADGAKAYRVSLQVNTPSARRLHFWRLPDGRIELSKVCVHDDFSIA